MSAKKHKREESEELNEQHAPQEEPEVLEAQEAGEYTPREQEVDVEVPAVIPAEEVEQLRSDLDQALAKQGEYLEGWQRERAEFVNYKKRMEREQSLGGQNAICNAIRRYLDIADDLGRALTNNNRPVEGSGAVWAGGIDLIYRKLLAAFEADGVKTIDTDGQYFDPRLHEAISHEDSPDHESGQIIEVVQQGYMLGDRVIRPARVRVAR